jgi:hypothetical protein
MLLHFHRCYNNEDKINYTHITLTENIGNVLQIQFCTHMMHPISQRFFTITISQLHGTQNHIEEFWDQVPQHQVQASTLHWKACGKIL